LYICFTYVKAYAQDLKMVSAANICAEDEKQSVWMKRQRK